jgi:hypothetical protein
MKGIITSALTPAEETGELQIMHLKRYWHKSMLIRQGQIKPDAFLNEWELDRNLIFTLGLGLEQTITYLYVNAPSFEQFEKWITETNGTPAQQIIENFNKLITGNNETSSTTIQKVLDDDQLNFWQKNGYLIIRNAVPKEDCERTIDTICEFIGITRDDRATWYQHHPARQGIMVQLFQHPILEKNRNSEKVRLAYEQLWNNTSLRVTADRVGFNPPETDQWKFPGPRLHWDAELKVPFPLGLQGILYLADTAENQGALSVVPGFHNHIDDWINGLPVGADPLKQDLYALGPIPIAANAGDFITWHHALPHGSSPNTATKPRFVQYFTYEPFEAGR